MDAEPKQSIVAKIAEQALFLETTLPDPVRQGGATCYDLTGRWRVGESAVVAIGTFDGVHIGHRALIAEAADDARRRGVPLVIVTFVPDPALVLLPSAEKAMILSAADRLRALASLEPDAIVAFDFDRTFSKIRYDGFFTERLLGVVDALAVHVGRDFSLGRGGEGTVEALSVLAGAYGIQLFGHPLIEWEGEPVTSTRIRALLDEGAIRTASDLLGRYPFVRGRVLRGRGEGRSLGFPTANVHFDRAYAFPRDGVFCGIALADDIAYPAAINFGEPPTFDEEPERDESWLAEASLLGFSGDLYDRELAIICVERLRGSRKFDDVSELVDTVKSNLVQVERLLGASGERVA